MNGVKLDPIWRQAALDSVREFPYGAVIPHKWLTDRLEVTVLEEGAKLSAKEHRLLSFDLLRKVDNFREELLTVHQRYLVSVRGIGYKIIEPPHQTKAAMDKMHSDLRKSISSAMSALVNVNEQVISLEDSRENSDAKSKLAWLSTVGCRHIGGPSAADPKIP